MTRDTDKDPLERDFSADIAAGRFKPAQFEFAAKDRQINLRVSQALLDALKARAAERRIPYQRYVRQLIEADLVEGRD
ncbi:MAG: CopG family antitoxin [Oceanicaulis sp.]